MLEFLSRLAAHAFTVDSGAHKGGWSIKSWDGFGPITGVSATCNTDFNIPDPAQAIGSVESTITCFAYVVEYTNGNQSSASCIVTVFGAGQA